MKTIVPLLGWALFLFSACNFVTGYGTRWECGRYYMPKTVMASDGHRWQDGKPIPVPIRDVAGSGMEEEAMLLLLVLLAGALTYWGVAVYRFHRAAVEFRKRFGRDFRRR